jgi:putative molybdopterin biosynthesis protein
MAGNVMSKNKSLSTQEVADILHVSKSTIYELIKRGEINSYKVGRKVRFTQDDVDTYIARSRHEHSTQPVKRVKVASTLLNPPELDVPKLIVSGQDVILDILANHLQQNDVNAMRCYLSSFEGLLSLYQGKVSAAACHLYAADEREFNTPFVKKLMPGVPAVLVNLSYRKQGFYVRKGNPKQISSWKDLDRSDVSILNRRAGSSARILLDEQLHCLGIPSAKVKGYEKEMKSHLTVAVGIAEGEADIGIGTERISNQIEGIDFIPLIEERFDLVIRKDLMNQKDVQTLIKVLNSTPFKKDVSHFSGNNYRDIGKLIAEV